MIRTLPMRVEPTIHQVDVILRRVEGSLAELGATVERKGAEVKFRMPLPWRAATPGLIHVASRGRVVVKAGAGGPRQVHYEVTFAELRWLISAISLLLVVLLWNMPRVSTAAIVAVVWLVCYLPLRAGAARRLQAVVARAAFDVVERRQRPRDAMPGTTPPAEAPREEPGIG